METVPYITNPTPLILNVECEKDISDPIIWIALPIMAMRINSCEFLQKSRFLVLFWLRALSKRHKSSLPRYFCGSPRYPDYSVRI